MKSLRSFRRVLLFLLAASLPAWTHPADVYRMELAPAATSLTIKVRASISPVDLTAPVSPVDLAERPLPSPPRFPRFHLVVDGQTLDWAERPPQLVTDGPDSWWEYESTYPLAQPPAEIHLALDPGDPAGFVVLLADKKGDVSTHLLSSQHPLDLNLGNKETVAVSDSVPEKDFAVFCDYVKHGIWHILTGYDHMLFMAALVLAATSVWDVIKVVTAFTLAHTVTLTLAVLNIVHLNERIVEPVIAASIVFVAGQNMFSPRNSHGWTRLMVAFAFGLFHGLGFAGGLLDAMAGLSGVTVIMAIVAFSIGVELGHQFVVIPLYSARVLIRRAAGPNGEEVSRRVTFWGSAAVTVAGSYYLFLALGLG